MNIHATSDDNVIRFCVLAQGKAFLVSPTPKYFIMTVGTIEELHLGFLIGVGVGMI